MLSLGSRQVVTVVFPHTVGDEKRISTTILYTCGIVVLAHAPRVKNVIVLCLIPAEPGYLVLAEGRVISYARINEDVLEDLQVKTDDCFFKKTVLL